MADEVNEIEQPEDARGGLAKLLPIGLALLALIGGMGVYFLVIAPRVAPDPAAEATQEEAETDALPEVPAQIVTIESNYVNLMRDGEGPAPLLAYGVKLECNNPETMQLVTDHQHRFEDMIMKLHDSRTRDELDDILMFKQSVQRQALQKANEILRRVQGENPDDSIKILGVYHYQLMVQDPAL